VIAAELGQIPDLITDTCRELFSGDLIQEIAGSTGPSPVKSAQRLVRGSYPERRRPIRNIRAQQQVLIGWSIREVFSIQQSNKDVF
jgi:hypothetical protein